MAADSPLGELSVDVSLKYGSLFRVSSPLFQRGLALSVYDKSGILWIFAGIRFLFLNFFSFFSDITVNNSADIAFVTNSRYELFL